MFRMILAANKDTYIMSLKCRKVKMSYSYLSLGTQNDVDIILNDFRRLINEGYTIKLRPVAELFTSSSSNHVGFGYNNWDDSQRNTTSDSKGKEASFTYYGAY